MTIEQIEAIEVFGNQLIDFSNLGELIFRFSVDLLVIGIIVGLIFYPKYREKNYLFTYLLINVSVFLVCTLLSSIKLKIGFAFGLFAVFSIIRYRTEQIPIRQMTYLFLVIILGVINALSNKSVSYAEMALGNLILVLCVYGLEADWFQHRDGVQSIRYEKIELIKPENHQLLLEDLKERTGLNIQKIEVERINFLNDTANLKAFYSEEEGVVE